MELAHLFFRSISSYWIFLCLWLIFYNKESKRFFTIVLITALLSSAFNAYLKELWRIPLNPLLGKAWWAFPSGHIQGIGIFLLSCILYTRSIVVLIVGGIILYGTHNSYIYFQYHDSAEMAAGFAMAVIFLVLIDFVHERAKNNAKIIPLYGLIAVIIGAWLLILLDGPLSLYWWLLVNIGINAGLALGFLLYEDNYYWKIHLNQIDGHNKQNFKILWAAVSVVLVISSCIFIWMVRLSAIDMRLQYILFVMLPFVICIVMFKRPYLSRWRMQRNSIV